jgi:hypothetical protein
MYSNARTWLAIQSATVCVFVASAYVRLLAPSTATNNSTARTSPVLESMMCGLSPE